MNQFDLQRKSASLENAFHTTQDTIERQISSIQAINTTIDSVFESSRFNTEKQVQSQKTLHDVTDAFTLAGAGLSAKLDAIALDIEQIRSGNNFMTSAAAIECSKEALGCVVRQEVRRTLMPIIEGNMTKSQTQNEALLHALSDIMETSAVEISRRTTSSELHRRVMGQGHTRIRKTPRKIQAYQTLHADPVEEPRKLSNDCAVSFDSLRSLTTGQPIDLLSQCPRFRSNRLKWSYWSSSSWLGTIRIEIRMGAKGNTTGSYFDVTISFWPSWYLLRKRCISIFYTSKADEMGYFQLCPMLATYPIIPEDAPVWHYIRKGDVDSLMNLFQNGDASPDDQDSHGKTLLHVCV
jgi:hypothetical protein